MIIKYYRIKIIIKFIRSFCYIIILDWYVILFTFDTASSLNDEKPFPASFDNNLTHNNKAM